MHCIVLIHLHDGNCLNFRDFDWVLAGSVQVFPTTINVSPAVVCRVQEQLHHYDFSYSYSSFFGPNCVHFNNWYPQALGLFNKEDLWHHYSPEFWFSLFVLVSYHLFLNWHFPDSHSSKVKSELHANQVCKFGSILTTSSLMVPQWSFLLEFLLFAIRSNCVRTLPKRKPTSLQSTGKETLHNHWAI